MADTTAAEEQLIAAIEHVARAAQGNLAPQGVEHLGTAAKDLAEAYAWLRVPRHSS